MTNTINNRNYTLENKYIKLDYANVLIDNNLIIFSIQFSVS